MKWTNLRALLFLISLTLLGSCEGSMGCSGCSGCGLEMQPIPGDFPLDKRVENGAQVHVSALTFDFLETNYDQLITYLFPDGLTFDVPPSTQDVAAIGTVDICPGGGCAANLNIVNLSITPVPPQTIRAVIQVEVAVYSLPVIIHQGLVCWWPCDTCDCSVDFVTNGSGRPYNSFLVNIFMSQDTATGYTSIQIRDAQIADDIENDDLSITNTNFCGVGICSLANLSFIKDIIIGQLESSLTDQIGSVNDSLCRTCETGCPVDTTCDDPDPASGICRYTDGTCVPMLLGMMGRMDVGGLLSAFSPSTQAVMDILFAAGGYAQTSLDPEAIDMGFYGGAEGAPVSECVRKAPVPCESEADCWGGTTCQELTALPAWILPCRRCAGGCPEGSTPRDSLLCDPDPADPEAEVDPSQPCMREDGTCVPLSYCADADGLPLEFEPPGAQVVPVAESLKVDQFSHCVYCDTTDNCTVPYTCDMFSVCTNEAGECQTVTEPVMVAAGISRTMIKRMVYGAVASGALCLEIPPGSIPQLGSGTLVAALPSLGNLVWGDAPVALVLRPAIARFDAPRPSLDALDSPDASVSDSPLLSITLRDVSIDFYTWVEETYSRFLTATFDLSLNVDLYVRNGTITPIIRNPAVSDVRVYNNDLLAMNEEDLRNTIGGLIQLAMGFLPPLDPIEVPPIEMINLDLPDAAAAHIQESGEDFLVLYASVSISETPPPPPALPAPVEAYAEITRAFNPAVDEAAGTAAMFRECGGQPSFTIRMSAASPSVQDRPMEYRWRLNGGPWSRWSKKETERIESLQFIFQGRHALEVQARLSGLDETADTVPAKLELLVDGIPPEISAGWSGSDAIDIGVHDMVSPVDKIDLKMRKVFTDGTQGGWSPLAGPGRIQVADDGLLSMVVSATDEAGNSSSGTFAIRGRPPLPTDSSSCGSCATVGSGSGSALPWLASLLLIAAGIALLGRRRGSSIFRGIILLVAAAALSAGPAGCSCGEEQTNGEPCADNQGPECCLTNEDCGPDVFCCTINHQCMEPPAPLESPPAPSSLRGSYNEGCEPGFFCTDIPAFVIGETEEAGCSFDWSCCTEADPLTEGRLGTYLGMDVAQGADPAIWISGYGAGASDSQRYGDLVAGPWNSASSDVDWEILDGLPAGGFVSNSPNGWRGGVSDPGDDVGLYTSLLLDDSGNPMISYYDRTNGALKFIQQDASGWLDPVVVDDGTQGHTPAVSGGDAGLCTEMVKVSAQAQAILYRGVTWEARDHAGATGYQVVHLATHLKAAVRTSSGWDVSVIASLQETPCWRSSCPAGHVCRVEDRLCWPPADADDHPECAECNAEQACLSGLDDMGAATGVFGCQDVQIAAVDVPEGIGLWTSATLSGNDIEAVMYDRTGGNLVWVAQEGGLWQEPVILDGDENDPDPALHGDRGWYPSMTVDGSGNRHIAYVDGLAETLDYMMVDPAGSVVLKETIDDGMDEGNAEHDLVGDNSSIQVDSSGRIRVIYQNSSDGILMMALRDTAGTWSLQPITDPDAGFMGYYALQRIVQDTSYVAHFFFNFESPPTAIGVDVLVCTVDAAGAASCG